MKKEIISPNQQTIPFFNYGTSSDKIYHAHESDAGYDVRNTTGKSVTLKPHETIKLPLGFGLLLPEHTALLFSARSGHGSRGLQVNTIPIDCGYTGEIRAIITNNNDHEYTIDSDERFGQFFVVPVLNNLHFVEANVEDYNTDRGAGGFNSSGLK